MTAAISRFVRSLRPIDVLLGLTFAAAALAFVVDVGWL